MYKLHAPIILWGHFEITLRCFWELFGIILGSFLNRVVRWRWKHSVQTGGGGEGSSNGMPNHQPMPMRFRQDSHQRPSYCLQTIPKRIQSHAKIIPK